MPPPKATNDEERFERRRDLKERRKNSIKKTRDEVINNNALFVPPSAEYRLTKRPRERNLRQIINYVIKWRELHSGVLVLNEKTGKQEVVRYPLQEAANWLGMSKKTLDHY